MMPELDLLLRIVKGQPMKSAKMMKEAFVSGYAGSLSPFIEESFSESFTIVTPLEKEDSHFHSYRHSMRYCPVLFYPIHTAHLC